MRTNQRFRERNVRFTTISEAKQLLVTSIFNLTTAWSQFHLRTKK